MASLSIPAVFGRRPTGPLAGQAYDASLFRYAPMFEALLVLRRQKATAYQQGRHAAAYSGIGAAQGIEGIARAYQGQLQAAFPGAGSGTINNKLGISPAAVSGALAQMAAMQRAGVPSAQAQLRSQYLGDQSDVSRQLLSTLSQAGAYRNQTYGQLVGDQRKARTQAAQQIATQRVRLMTAGINPDTGSYDPSLKPPKSPSTHAPVDGVNYQTWLGMTPEQRRQAHRAWGTSGPGRSAPPLLPGGVKPLSQQAHNTFRSSVLSAQQEIRPLLQGVNDTHPAWSKAQKRNAIATILLQGDPANKIKPVAQDSLSVALDLAFDGHVSGVNARGLHARGYSVRGLGFPGGSRPRNPYSGLH